MFSPSIRSCDFTIRDTYTQSQLQPAQYYEHPAVTRYFDHIQHQPVVRKSADALGPAFSVVPLDLEHAPAIVRKADAPKEKKKKAPTASSLATPASSSGIATPVSVEPSGAATPVEKPSKSKAHTPAEPASGAVTPGGGKPKKEKKEKKAGEEGGKKGNNNNKAAATAEDAGEPVPSMIDLRVGHIVQSKYCRTSY